jgi:uncharacterized membrane protein
VSEPMSTSRLEAFSDGVFAIAITLLVLDLHITNAPPGHLAHALAKEWPHYATFVVSFLTIGIIWVNHHSQFQIVSRVDRPMLFINLFLLMVVVVIPFPTGLLADHLHSGSDQHIAAAVYSGTLLVMGIAFFGNWRYAAAHSHLLHTELTPAQVRRLVNRNIVGLSPYALAVGLAFISAPVSLAICGAVALYYVFPGSLPEHEGSPVAPP